MKEQSTENKGHSWREQRRAVVMTEVESSAQMEFISLWQASHRIAMVVNCQPDTARKEIKKAITTSCARYGATWRWKEQNATDTTDTQTAH